MCATVATNFLGQKFCQCQVLMVAWQRNTLTVVKAFSTVVSVITTKLHSQQAECWQLCKPAVFCLVGKRRSLLGSHQHSTICMVCGQLMQVNIIMRVSSGYAYLQHIKPLAVPLPCLTAAVFEPPA
jgi:hypothetical protein